MNVKKLVAWTIAATVTALVASNVAYEVAEMLEDTRSDVVERVTPVNLESFVNAQAWHVNSIRPTVKGGDKELRSAIDGAIEYWATKPVPAPVTIKVTKKDACGGSNGCATLHPSGLCELYVHKQFKGNRWALIAIAKHEVGHCYGQGHDDVMSENGIIMHS